MKEIDFDEISQVYFRSDKVMGAEVAGEDVEIEIRNNRFFIVKALDLEGRGRE